MKRNRTRQIKSKKGGARVRQTARKSTGGPAPRKTLTTTAAVKMNENNGNNGNNGNNKRNENSGTNEKDLRIKELEEKLNTIHDISRA
jgi:Tfp pilus assembly major pilin PilA